MTTCSAFNMHFQTVGALCAMLLFVFSVASPTDSKHRRSLRVFWKREASPPDPTLDSQQDHPGPAPRSTPAPPSLPKHNDDPWFTAAAMCVNPRPAGNSGPCNCYTIWNNIQDCPNCSLTANLSVHALYQCHKCSGQNPHNQWSPDQNDDDKYHEEGCQTELQYLLSEYSTQGNQKRVAVADAPAPRSTQKPEDKSWQHAAAICSSPKGPSASGQTPDGCNCHNLLHLKETCHDVDPPCSSDVQTRLQALYDCHKCGSRKMNRAAEPWVYHYPNDDSIYRAGKCLDILSPKWSPTPSEKARLQQEINPPEPTGGLTPQQEQDFLLHEGHGRREAQPQPTSAQKADGGPWNAIADRCSRKPARAPGCNCKNIREAKASCSPRIPCSSDAQKRTQALSDCHLCDLERHSFYFPWQDDWMYKAEKCDDILSPTWSPTPSAKVESQSRTQPAQTPSPSPTPPQYND